MTPNFEEGDYIDCYSALVDARSTGLISKDGFEDGYTIFRFKIREDTGGRIAESTQRAHSRLKLKFKQPLEKNITLLVYGKFAASVEIDHKKKVTVHE